MPHLSETAARLPVVCVAAQGSLGEWPSMGEKTNDVWFMVLPLDSTEPSATDPRWAPQLRELAETLGPDALLVVLATPFAAAQIVPAVSSVASLQLWVAVKSAQAVQRDFSRLPQHHSALLVFSKYRRSLRHTKTRIGYTFCPYCDKTTKDYGGKKHTYHHFGTLLSDVWRDIALEPSGPLTLIEERLADLFAVEPHQSLHVCDLRKQQCHSLGSERPTGKSPKHRHPLRNSPESQLLVGDCLDQLGKLPDDSIDFCFADPPYNIAKKYDSWDDSLDLAQYFEWCDQWLDKLARVLRPGGTCAVLNIPQFAVRHFTHLARRLVFQNWIVWEGLSLPVRMIMPAHYSIVCFSKGPPRELPGIRNAASLAMERSSLTTLKEFYCVRQSCVQNRAAESHPDRQPIDDLWWDIHRLKHNSRRVDHPCQLPPALMHRLIALFTNPGEIVLDPFNGAGTTSLCAAQLNRRYIGIEMSERYHKLAEERHGILARGGDPFAKATGVPKAKNSRVKRIGDIEYAVSKKKLQLEVREIAQRLGRLPSREDVAQHSQYPIRYFDDYFLSWGEVCAAARTTGMIETRVAAAVVAPANPQNAFAFMDENS